MALRTVARIRAVGLIALLALALTATGFAHRAPAPLDGAKAAYLLGGGDLSQLCGALDEDAGTGAGDCPACRIAGAVLPPAPPLGVAAIRFELLAKVVAPRASRMAPEVRDAARGTRDPPRA